MPSASNRTRTVATAALIAALLAASAWISLPLGAVPVTLQVFIVLLAALLLPPGAAAAAVVVYLLLGAVGIPVFSGPAGGIGVLAGPRGGYLLGFLAAAAAGSALRRVLRRRAGETGAGVAAVALAIALVYALGWWRLAAVTAMGAGPAFAAGVAPFLLVDAVKAAVAIGVAAAVRRAGYGD